VLSYHWEADDWCIKHKAEAERVLARNANRSPGLVTVLKQYRDAENDTALPESTRRLWKQMADEIEARINENGVEQLPLW
jgi:hypothetical protein